MASEAGKGSKQRPQQISNEEYAQRWDLIFKRDKENEDTELETDLPEQLLSED